MLKILKCFNYEFLQLEDIFLLSFVDCNCYLESTSSKKEQLLGMFIESSAISVLILPITCCSRHDIRNLILKTVYLPIELTCNLENSILFHLLSNYKLFFSAEEKGKYEYDFCAHISMFQLRSEKIEMIFQVLFFSLPFSSLLIIPPFLEVVGLGLVQNY